MSTVIGAGVRDGAKVSDSDDFVRGLESHLQIAFRLAYVMLRHRNDAEDAVQEAAAKAWRKRHTFTPGAELRPWFLAIVANECRMISRRNRRRSQPAEPIEMHAVSDDAADLRRAIGRLDVNSRLVLVLRYYLDLPYQEIARTLGISAGAARVRLHRALQQLRPAFEVEEGPRS